MVEFSTNFQKPFQKPTVCVVEQRRDEKADASLGFAHLLNIIVILDFVDPDIRLLIIFRGNVLRILRSPNNRTEWEANPVEFEDFEEFIEREDARVLTLLGRHYTFLKELAFEPLENYVDMIVKWSENDLNSWVEFSLRNAPKNGILEHRLRTVEITSQLYEVIAAISYAWIAHKNDLLPWHKLPLKPEMYFDRGLTEILKQTLGSGYNFRNLSEELLCPECNGYICLTGNEIYVNSHWWQCSLCDRSFRV